MINTGVDITLVVEPADREAALRAAKICGVCGISTAVLQVAPDEVGKRTIAAYCELTGRIVLPMRRFARGYAGRCRWKQSNGSPKEKTSKP
mgnify:CR=1 FL=1